MRTMRTRSSCWTTSLHPLTSLAEAGETSLSPCTSVSCARWSVALQRSRRQR
ncbi:hypothetical protein PF005_g12233 [Phytophthora fragariae]|uniref:Uncharacterized protein n=1 Tax=Phytophthora fragariae TaxID=53985 RepID=A0A6A3EYY7_9STRA|nr:hypothetical protein PF003_g13858 [Phytophthora fragariae]KAE8936620.1 hypothetical protein PF009_g13462 [Phytophthora fragariae]KAE9007044.1 hypothetical protein PF011_g11299 [Phytophthora fragariae]KAE9115927.1 hypothetical protein PF010_g9146 [Phytophthora fragariae]KAE9128112.1 hypothetical protein PF007_g5377 [Phytophthora fragariae]